MKALVLQDDPKDKIILKEEAIPTLKTGEVLIKMKASALNHRDEWCRQGMYPGMTYPSILGSDGCGVVEKVESTEDETWLHKEVIINPNIDWGNNPNAQGHNYRILGMPTHGTFAEYLVVPSNRLHEKPAHLSPEEAAALPLGGLTAYRAVFTRGELKEGQNILVSGIGGGVAQFAFQFAKAMEAKVWVTSGSEEKLTKMKEMGAAGGVNYKADKWHKELLAQTGKKGFNVIIDSAGGEGFANLANILAPAGNLVFYGATLGSPKSLNMPRLFFGQVNIKGSTMGNDEEFKQMIEFVGKHKIKPLLSSVRPFAEIVSAFDEMKAGKQFGKLVIKISE